jgi:hypothetical protein
MKRVLAPAILAVCGLAMVIGIGSCLGSHDDVFSKDKLLTANAEDLKNTVITPHLEASIKPGQNLLWCGTFQLVWNEICGLIDQDIHFTEDPPEVAPLNKKEFTAKDLDDGSYVALAGFVKDGIHAKIREALKKKFNGQASPHLLPNPDKSPRPQDIVAYAYLFKHLEFKVPMERLEEPLSFGNTRVSAFGLGPYKPAQQAIYPEISVVSYSGPDDFIVELKSKAAGDQIILTKTKPGDTLLKTVTVVLDKVKTAKPDMAQPGDILAVPRFNFDLTRRFGEVMGRKLIVNPFPPVASSGLHKILDQDLQITEALQNIRFEMDEKGVRLRSESHISLSCAEEAMPRGRHMIFDKPFLVMLKRTDAATPYFALWVEDAELLVPEEE